MKYVCALPVILLLAALDVLFIMTIIGMLVLADNGPYSFRFAREVWK